MSSERFNSSGFRSSAKPHSRQWMGWGGTVRDADTRVNPDLQTFYNSFFASSPHVVFLYPHSQDERKNQREFQHYVCTDCLNTQRMTEPGPCSHCGASFEQMLPVWISGHQLHRKEKGWDGEAFRFARLSKLRRPQLAHHPGLAGGPA